MSTRDFIKSRLFWKQIGLALAIGVAIFIILIIWLNIYTHHGQSRPTPEVRGLSIKEAKAVASKNRMRFQVIELSLYRLRSPGLCGRTDTSARSPCEERTHDQGDNKRIQSRDGCCT